MTGGHKNDKDGHHVTKAKENPEPYEGEHKSEYAGKGFANAEPLGEPYLHEAPKHMEEPPLHFNTNMVRLELHLDDPRQRLAGMSDAEREWRKKYLHDQQLAPEEPIYVGAVNACVNPLRKLYRLPWNYLERRFLVPTLGLQTGHYVRQVVPKAFMIWGFGIWMAYYLKYHNPKWWDFWRPSAMRPKIPLTHDEQIRKAEPGLIEKGLRNYQRKQDYYDLEFKHRYSHLKLDHPVRP